MRFDDTNPAKEDAEFERVILEDLKLLQVKPDVFTHTSDHFDRLLGMCEQLLDQGLAYCDDTDGETMKKEREERRESKNRNNSVEKNRAMWEEMKKGSTYGLSCCVRAKIDMNSDNGCLRDPTIYRCKNEPHVRTGTKYRVYPTYDFACPVVDSVEGVTHALRTTEYHDRDDQYFWFIDRLGLRPLHIYEYSRLNMNNTVLSKRKLTWFVAEGLVDSWDDPRFPTVRGVLRRGLTVQGLRDFIVSQGSSRSVVNMEWDKIWSFNKKVIDSTAPRHTALQGDLVPVLVSGATEQATTAQRHPKDPSLGTKTVWVGPKVLVEAVDAEQLHEGQNATFINWGNIMIKKVNRQEGRIVSVEAEANTQDTDYKKTLKVTWLADNDSSTCTPIICVYFDHLINKSVLGKDEDFKNFIGHETRAEVSMVGDPELRNAKAGDIVQLQRKGFFRVDEAYGSASLSSCRERPAVLFSIPDGHSKDAPTAASIKKLAGMSAKEREQSAQGKKAEKSPQEEVRPVVGAEGGTGPALLEAIKVQGDKIRQLKGSKADKNVVMAEVDVLKKLKKDFQNATGLEWKPDIVLPAAAAAAPTKASGPGSPADIHTQIKAQGDKVRELKAAKAEKDVVKREVDTLLVLKKDFKTASGQEWKPDMDVSQLTGSMGGSPATPASPSSVERGSSTAIDLHHQIKSQGDTVRARKSEKADKDTIKQAVDVLLALKAQFKAATGIDWKPDIDVSQFSEAASNGSGGSVPSTTRAKTSPTKPAPAKPAPAKVTPVKVAKQDETTTKKQTRLGLEAKKEENLAEWYSQVITKAEMIEYYNVSGCYILRPWAFAVWDAIRSYLDDKIKAMGVENAYFPLFVSRDALEREKTHLSDFSPEVAWVTRSGSSEMAEPVAIRPTSETVMYPAVAKWVQSHRDLPLRLNQWNNVVRWEFKQPTPFLRTREFLWQEGHTAFATKAEAEEEVYHVVELYAQVYEELLAVPVVRGRKTEKEKFAGADFTTTTEAFISASGRGIQGATSHHLGQNFSKMFEIVFEDPETKEKRYVYQNSWGLTTRTVGVMVMVHGDNKGLVLPPRVASVQAILMPVGITAKTTEAEKVALYQACQDLEAELQAAGVRAKRDLRDNVTPAWKFNHWELKGVPLRLELGPREVVAGKVFVVRRDTGEKLAVERAGAGPAILAILEGIHRDMFNRALKDLNGHKVKVQSWAEFTASLDSGNVLLAPFCGREECEDAIKKDSAREEVAEPGAPAMGAKGLCIPFDQPGLVDSLACIHPACKVKPQYYTLFGRSY